MKDKEHIRLRDLVENLLNKNKTIKEIANILSIPIGTRFVKGSVKWYRYCIRARQNQQKAIESHPNLYSLAGKIAQQKHPEIGKNLGKKYGIIQGKINAERLKGNSEYFSKIAKRLQEINPNHSKINIRKAHETMKNKGTFNEHQRLAALKCREKHPEQLKAMSKKAHEIYPLALLALESRRKNYPYKLNGCLFDSEGERLLCQKLIEKGLIEKPIEKENVHFRINKKHIDFFIQNKVFIEYHPILKVLRPLETNNTYLKERRDLLDENGFKNYPLIVISSRSQINNKIEEIKKIISQSP